MLMRRHLWPMQLIQLVLSSIGATVGRPLVAKYRSRAASAPVSRSGFISSIPCDEPILEIGPFDRPWLSGPEVRYFDVLSQDKLKARAATEPRRDPEGCPFIHYVSPTGDLSIVDAEFAAVFSSHCIEHQPDLIHHLREVGRMLRPGGRYYLIVPDKRFCFDHFLPESTVDDIRSAKGRSHHTEKAITEHAIGTTHNNNLLHWLGVHGRARTNDPSAQALNEEFLKRARSGEYVDVHAWQFTPASFRRAIQSLHEEGEIRLKPTSVYDTGFGMIEFMAILTRTD